VLRFYDGSQEVERRRRSKSGSGAIETRVRRIAQPDLDRIGWSGLARDRGTRCPALICGMYMAVLSVDTGHRATTPAAKSLAYARTK
jgi:hypothetical protein